MNNSNGLIQEPVPISMADNGQNGQHGPKGSKKQIYIHIDLKGARPQLPFWINFCRLLRDWGGVDGLIMEWEDSYPLEVLRLYPQEFVYSRQEAARMTTVAEDCGLTVIPLVQTFGHLEYVLKHFVHLREHPERPDCLIPIESFTDESFGVVTQLIDDVFNICPKGNKKKKKERNFLFRFET